jgi:hypothetical protein
MKRTLASVGLCCLASLLPLLTAKPAEAQNFDRSGSVSISLERVFGVHYLHDELERPGGTDVQSGTVLGVGWYNTPSPLHWPRVALDGFITDRLSIGGAFGYFTQGDDFHGDGLLFSPRIGYVFPISRVFSFWLRGGVTFVKLNSDSLFGIAGEGLFVVSPKPTWGITFGPTLDFDFVGDRGPNTHWRQYSFAFPTVGILGTF